MASMGFDSLMDEHASEAPKDAPVELYVDGGVLNNYPIDSFDGWWLSMAKEDKFFRRVMGNEGHKNYVERFGALHGHRAQLHPKLRTRH